MNSSFINDLRLLASELFKYRTALIGSFVGISFSVLGIGLLWSNLYQSHVTIQVNEKNIVQPLLKGNAVATSISDISKNAKALITSRRVIVDMINDVGLMKKGMSPTKQEQLIESIRNRTAVKSLGHNLIQISFKDKKPEIAKAGAEKFGEIFMQESRSQRSNESVAAFEFIDSQVKAYHAKLVDAEEKLKKFRSEHLDSTPGSETQLSDQINRLNRRLQDSELDYKEELIKYESLKKQLSGEAESVAGLSREGELRKRIAELQSQMDNLKLTYTDTYPDVVQLRYQISDLEKELQQEKSRKAKGLPQPKLDGADDQRMITNPLYQKLRQAMSDSQTQLATLTARIQETKKLLAEQEIRGKKIHGGEAELSDITRDYEVNRDIYQDLLKRRENARVSKDLQDEQKDRLILYEAAFLPAKPSGIRFLHFMIAGLLLGVLIPVGLFYTFQRTDPRIRSVELIHEKLGLPILAVMPVLATQEDVRETRRHVRSLVSVIVLTLIFYAAIGLLRFASIL